MLNGARIYAVRTRSVRTCTGSCIAPARNAYLK